MPNSADTDSIEGVLARDGVWVSTTAGTSMWPMLRDRRDTVVVRPAEVLLDECASALDGVTERKMLARLRALGRTIVIVTHRPAALSVCDRVIEVAG